VKTPICRHCKEPFVKFTTTQIVCSTTCALDLVKAKKAKAYQTETRRMKRERNLSDRSYQLKKAQEAFNAFIRARDKQSDGCISCGITTGRWTAGHYKTDKALRFNEDNCHGQCWWSCNSNKSGNITEYRPRLVEKIGAERVEALEVYHEPPKYTLGEIVAIRDKYKLKLKQLEAV